MIFASDLDGTLIHSQKTYGNLEGTVCVEYKKNFLLESMMPVSCMLKNSISIYKSILETGKCLFIPVTARSIEQFQRIHILQDCPYAIMSNGGTIMIHGKPCLEWKEKMESYVKKEKDIYEEIIYTLSSYASYIEYGPRIIDNIVIFAKFYTPPQTDSDILYKIKEITDRYHWTLCVQNKKIYIAPASISKEYALDFLLQRLPKDMLITAGDGATDIHFMRMGDMRFVPYNSDAYKAIQNMNMYTVVSDGPVGTHEMLQHIQQKFHL